MMARLAIAALLVSCSNAALAEPSFTIDNATANEDSGAIAFLVRKHGTLNDQPSKVLVHAIPGTAKGGADYVEDAYLLPFTAAETQKLVIFDLVNDATPEPGEKFTVKLIRGVNARLYDGTATGTITDSDVAPPPTQTCPDGSVIPATSACPPHEHPPGGFVLTADVKAITNEDMGFDTSLGVRTVPVLPVSSVGEAGFRFICGLAGFAYNDPIAYPGQPGASHLHQIFGNTEVDAFSTRESLAKKGSSTCNYVTTGPNGALVILPFAVNRSGYWIPAMLDGGGNAVGSDYITVYYKRARNGAPECGDPSDVANRRTGICVGVPRGLTMIWGSDMKGGYTLNQRVDAGRPMYFNCSGTGATAGHYADIEEAKAKCVAGGKIGIIITAPNCWDMKHSDVPDHRSHVAYGSYGSWGYYRCPATHPGLMPQLTLQYWFTVTAQMLKPGYEGAHLSSDLVDKTKAPGWSLHGDYKEAWLEWVRLAWEGPDGCVGGGKNCSSGHLGNGLQLVGAGQPIKNGRTVWADPDPLVPLSSIPRP